MATFVKCGKCGLENRLGSLFCRQCGNRLDLTNVKPSGSSSEGSGGALARAVRLIIFFGLLIALAFLCWPVSPGGDAPSADGSRLMPNRLTALRSAAMRGNEVIEQFSEADINAHLNARLVSPAKTDGIKLVLREVRLDIKPDETEVWVKCSLQFLPVTYVTTTRMTRAPDGRHAFAAGSVYIGHLPMPGPLRDRAIKQIIGTFSRLPEELALLNGLPGVHVQDGMLVLSTTKTSP